MFKIILFSLLILAELVHNQELSIRKILIDELDKDERLFLATFNASRIESNTSTIEFSHELTTIAQIEAERLSRLGRIELPKYNLAKSYYGVSFKRNGKIGNLYVGFRMCHNNIINIFDTNVYSLNHDCSPNGIDYGLANQVGIGRSSDLFGNVYSVRLFYTNQTRNVSLNQDLIISPVKLSLEEHDLEEADYILKYNDTRIESEGGALNLSSKLMKIAKKEADRLAKLGHLDFPKHDLRKSYFGASFKIEGKIENNYVGFKICHDTIVRSEDKVIYYVDENCYSDKIDQNLPYDVGYGSAMDSNENIFKVRLFALRDKEDKKKSARNLRKLLKNKRKLKNKDKKKKKRVHFFDDLDE